MGNFLAGFSSSWTVQSENGTDTWLTGRDGPGASVKNIKNIFNSVGRQFQDQIPSLTEKTDECYHLLRPMC